MRCVRKVFALLLTLLLEFPVSPLFAAENRVALAGHVPKQLQTAVKLNAMNADEQMDLSLVVKLDPVLMDQTLEQIYGQSAPKKRQYLSSTEFAQRFGLADKRQKIKDFATANGLTVDLTQDQPESMVVRVSGSAGVVEKAFSVQLYHYRNADGKEFRAPDSDPMIPASLAPHLHAVIGLSDVALLHPHLRVAPQTRGIRPSFTGTGPPPGFGLAPADIKSIYSLNTVTQTGSGQTVALFELDGYLPSDITAYETQFSLPLLAPTFIGVDSMSNTCGSGCVEVTLDIDMVLALAPGVSKILVYSGPNPSGVVDTYNRIATDNLASVVSTSWGLDEPESDPATVSSENMIFSRMAAQGQTIYAASGDNGAYDDTNNSSLLAVDDPASQPFVTGVGGTSLSGTIATHTETVWNNSYGASGGGVSTVWSIPNYQMGISGTKSQTFRNVPDIALNADPVSGYSIFVSGSGGWGVVGGTSAAAPLWAAFTALINQQRQATSSANFGFANPTLYQLGTGSTYSSLFNDITSGNNLFYSAGVGYDNATGWGSYIGAALINAVTVVAPPVITQNPTDRSVGVGQPATFNVQASGVGNSYQWLKGVSSVFSAITGATASSYSTPAAATADDQTQYKCLVTNAGGSATSSSATLTVSPNANLGNILIYPNPWDTRKHTGVPLHFSGLPDGATVKLFTLSAHWIKSLTASGGAANWDLTNDSGQSVGSGYYLYLITDNQGDKITGKIAVIK